MPRTIAEMGAFTEGLMGQAYALLRARFEPSAPEHLLLTRLVVEEEGHRVRLRAVGESLPASLELSRTQVAFLVVQHTFVGRLLSLIQEIQAGLAYSVAIDRLVDFEREVAEDVLPRLVEGFGDGADPLEDLIGDTLRHGRTLQALHAGHH